VTPPVRRVHAGTAVVDVQDGVRTADDQLALIRASSREPCRHCPATSQCGKMTVAQRMREECEGRGAAVELRLRVVATSCRSQSPVVRVRRRLVAGQ
jgi:hypothetical protein